MNHKLIKIENGPSIEELFQAAQFIYECQTALFIANINGTSQFVPCLVSGVTSVKDSDDSWNVTLILRHKTIERLGLMTEHLEKIIELHVSATYSTSTKKGEISFPQAEKKGPV